MTSKFESKDIHLARWAIVVTRFPFTDLALAKPRPVLTLTDRSFHAASRHAVCSMITTGAQSAWPEDLEIFDIGDAGLRKPCVIRAKIFTLSLDMLTRQIGSLSSRDSGRLAQAWRGLLLG
jgi:mRNA interferase MazF